MTETLKITFPAICDIFNHTLLVTKLEAHDLDSGSYSFNKDILQTETDNIKSRILLVNEKGLWLENHEHLS